MQPRKYPPILPAAPPSVGLPSPAPSTSTSSSSAAAPNTKDAARSRRAGAQPRPGACTECRGRKIRCDGVRPVCSNCNKRGQPHCVYPERPKNAHDVMELLELLRSQPEPRAVDLLRGLRAHGDLAHVLARTKGGGGGGGGGGNNNDNNRNTTTNQGAAAGEWDQGQGTTTTTTRMETSESDYSSNNNNNNNNNNRPLIEPELMASHPKAYPPLRHIDGAALARSHLLQPLAKIAPETPSSSGEATPTVDAAAEPAAAQEYREPGRAEPPGFGSGSGSYCDERLRDLRIELWTDIDVSSDLAARALSLFITTDHPLLGLFDPRALITGLLSGERRLCSVFLVHALMCLACQMYSAVDRAALDQAEKFCAKAEELWKKEEDSHHAMAGAILLSLSLMGQGKDHAVLLYALAGQKMGERLGLFGPDGTRVQGLNEKATEEEMTSISFAAWGVFNWNLLALTEFKFREIIAWMEAVPDILLRREEGAHYVTVFHIWLHCVILDLVRPFIGGGPDDEPRQVLKTFAARDSPPREIFAASVGQLKQLIVEYRGGHVASTYSMLWHSGLIYLANAMLSGADDDPEWRLYLLLCIYGYERLSRPYRIAEVITRGLLAMALRDTDMSGREAQQIMAELRDHGGGLDRVKERLQEGIRATFAVDLDMSLVNPEQATVENMAGEFESMALFQDFLDHNQMEE
ncbi:hypothetical protein GGR56DRAFT_676123 [Xylariaceae sp. FL0804]|nr:hypothetical protein GGR56DRAFT_676123 [Xylariaceae sp. FL0804]